MNIDSDILIIDDQRSNLRLLEDLLKKEGYQVRTADSHQMAIDSAIQKSPGLILLEVRIPGKDGFGLCQHLKLDKRTQHVPIIFISSLNDVEARVSGFEAGGVDFISKPFQELEVLARVKTHMRLHEMQQTLEQLVDNRTSELTKSKTSLEQNIKALKESEERFSMIIENANEVIVIAQNEVIKYCNPQITELSGYSIEEIYSMSFLEFIHPDDKEKVMREYHKRITAKQLNNNYSVRILTKDGREKFVFISSALVDWDNKPATLAMITDITRLKKVESELISSEERFRQLMEQSPMGMELLSPDGKITRVNSAWNKLWKVNEEEAAEIIDKYNMITDPQLERLGLKDEVKEAFKGKYTILPPIHYDSGQTVEDFDLKLQNKFKSPWIQSHLFPVRNDSGEIEFIVNTYIDITQLKLVEQQVAEQRGALASIDRARRMGQLTGSIAHEINQPLTGILSNAQAAELMLMNDRWEADELVKIMAEIAKDTKRARDVIHNLRELYKDQKIDLYPIDINPIINETSQLLHSEFVKFHVQEYIESDPELPMVHGNSIQIQQVLVNLIINGNQAMKGIKRVNRKLYIRTSYDKNELKVWVEDCGTGINQKNIDRIFEPLATWKSGGTGMGLAISNSIIEAHGGRMWAENRQDEGASVGFILPILKENPKS